MYLKTWNCGKCFYQLKGYKLREWFLQEFERVSQSAENWKKKTMKPDLNGYK